MSSIDGINGISPSPPLTPAEIAEARLLASDFVSQLREARAADAAAAAQTAENARRVAESEATAAATAARDAQQTNAAAPAATEATATATPDTTTATAASAANLLLNSDAIANPANQFTYSDAAMELQAEADALAAAELERAAVPPTVSPDSPQYIDPARYPAYAQTPPKSPLAAADEAERDADAAPTEESGLSVFPILFSSPVVPTHERERNSEEGNAAGYAWNRPGAETAERKEQPPPDTRPADAAGSLVDLRTPYSDAPQSRRLRRRAAASNLDRFGALVVQQRFYGNALVYIGAANGLALPANFLSNPAYLAVAGKPEVNRDVRGWQAVHRGLRDYLSPEKVAERVVDFAISLYNPNRKGKETRSARRDYADAAMGMADRAYRQNHLRYSDGDLAVASGDSALTETRNRIERGFLRFVQDGPDPVKNVPDGLYDRLRVVANDLRIFYGLPGRPGRPQKLAGNIALANVKPRLDAQA